MKPQVILNASLNTSRGSSLQVKLGITIIVLTTLTLVGFGVYQYHTRRSQAQVNLTALATTMAGQMSLSLASPLWNYSMKDLERQVKAAMQDQHLLSVVVTDPGGKTLSSKTRDDEWNIVDADGELTEEFPPVAQEIMYEEKPIGTVRVLMTTRFMQAELRQAVMELSMAILALDLILFGGLLISLRILLIAPLAYLLRVAPAMADGDFQQDIAMFQRDEIGMLANAFEEMQTKIAAVVREVKTSTFDVAQRSREMRVAADQMSAGAAEQATATEEVSSSMEEMAATIRQTAENARLTEDMAVTSAEDARAGKQAVTDIINAMKVIAERISLVQEIAGQTNILSLNATIEAAKAQEYGKGFAVVASSVKDLARQSRAAAEDIRTLVHSCVALSVHAGEVLQRLAPKSEKTAELVQEISAASQEQSRGVDHVNQALQQLDLVTQQNSATAEEMAVTAESLNTQADALQQTMAFFTVNEAALAHHAPDDDVVRRLQQLDKAQLTALLTSALSGQARDAETAIADPTLQTQNSSEAGDDRDREFERY